jgi:MOSC domain-containing protein YiiM
MIFELWFENLQINNFNRKSLCRIPLRVQEVSSAKLVSLNVARPQLVVYRATTINTGIFKKPVSGPVELRTLNLDGDRQADLAVPRVVPGKAVYAYPSKHCPDWRRELPGIDLPWGMFGENFTTAGLAEDGLHVGDRFQIGSSIVMVRQPRTPCQKLTANFQREDILERFFAQRAQWLLLFGRAGRVGRGEACV